MERAVCIKCGAVGKRLGATCEECGGAVVRQETVGERMRAERREAESAGVSVPPHIADLPRSLVERTREELRRRGVLRGESVHAGRHGGSGS